MKRVVYPENTSLKEFDWAEDAATDEQGGEVFNDLPIAFGAPIGQRHEPRRIVKHHRTTVSTKS